MSSDLLFEHFATLATAPDGIARLRELILQLAVQGKLGTQDIGDEPASVLLKEILKERKFITNKKTSLVISKDEFSFEIPEKWIFTKVGDISQIIRGITYKKGDDVPFPKENFVPILRSNNINKGINFEKLVYLPRNFVDEHKWLKLGDLVVAMSSGSANLVGKTAQIENEFEGSIGAFCGIIRPTPLILRGYLKYFFQCPYYRSVVSEFGQGIGINNLGSNNLQNILLPLPPLTEQHRIVAKVDRLMALCDKLEARQQQERAGCLRLGTASLAGLQNANSPEEFGRQWAQVCDAFDLILDCPENLAVLRQTILQLAVQGRLVRQESDDKVATFPLKEKVDNKLAKELKIFFSKPHKNLEDFFLFPKTWVFTSLINVTNIVDTQPNHRTPVAVENGVPYIGMKDIQNDGTINFKNSRKISNDVCQEHRNRYTLSKGDFIIGKIGTIGNPIKLRPPFDYTLSANILLIQPDPKVVSPDFIYYLFKSPMIETKLQEESSFSTSQPLYGIKKLRALRIPLPPLAEQYRIVANVDALMALCDTFESRLKGRAMIQSKFADAVVNVGIG